MQKISCTHRDRWNTVMTVSTFFLHIFISYSNFQCIFPLLGTHSLNDAVQWQRASAEQIMGPVISLVLLVTFSHISLLTVTYSLTWNHFWESKHSTQLCQTQHSLRHIAAVHGQHCQMPGLSSSKGTVQWKDKWHHLVFYFNNGRHLKGLCYFIWVFVLLSFLRFSTETSAFETAAYRDPYYISRSWGLQELIYSYRVWKLFQGK